jgi:hypothetical protein
METNNPSKKQIIEIFAKQVNEITEKRIEEILNENPLSTSRTKLPSHQKLDTKKTLLDQQI